MWFFIFVGIIFIVAVILSYYSDKQPTSVDLTQPVKLKFTKNEYNKYEISFYNPLKDSWWVIPSGYAGIHAPWSFHNKGSYGAYSLERLTCSYHEIESYKNQFNTLEDIQLVFDRMNSSYNEFKKREDYNKSLPNEIIC